MALHRVAIVAGEESGDILGAGLMEELKVLYPNVEFIGMGGSRMASQGLDSQYPIDRLSVMGLLEPLKRLPELLNIRASLAKLFVSQKVDLFIGIDSPDFNLGLARKLKQKGIRTVHYVSPSVWAWRQGRIKGIRQSLDLMLTLLPFEAQFYRDHNMPVEYVGHPLATELNPDTDKDEARHRIGVELSKGQKLFALLPGSRSAEIKHLMPLYLETIEKVQKINPEGVFVFAAVNSEKADLIRSFFTVQDFPLVEANTLQVISAADLVVAASGTTTLEVMLLNRPLIVAYRADWLSYKIIGSMVKVPYVSLPNLIAAKSLVNEYIQAEATSDNLSDEILSLCEDEHRRNNQLRAFAEMREELQLPSSRMAAEAIASLDKSVLPQ
ncbi:MAG: lipid-A-disaccharide synthase [Porticoccaceae bacterium]|jgi:lipid-A-disaccharide synthase|nr:lipid-A-disaccharide synthase [Porticoccaceae bacterium]